MDFYVYIIFSSRLDRFYIGYTSDLKKRIDEHNSGLSSYSSKATDWEIKYTEPFATREEVHKRELEIKRKKSRKYIEYLITGGASSVG